MAVFSIGFSNAYAEDAKASKKIDKTDKVEKVDAIPLKCSIKSLASIAKMLDIKSPEETNLNKNSIMNVKGSCMSCVLFIYPDGTQKLVCVGLPCPCRPPCRA